MSLLAIGLNHTTAPVEIREHVVFGADGLARAMSELTAVAGVAEAVIVSTCNRTELYCALNDAAADSGAVIDWFHGWHGLDRARIQPCLYEWRDSDVVRHVLRVAAGLDSMILGEPQIAGQLKSAYRSAVAHEAIGPELGKLFQHAFATGKEVRTDTAIGTSPVSVAFAAITLARQIFGDLTALRALLIGAGETIERAGQHLREAGLTRLTVANRDPGRALRVAERFDGQGISLAALPEVLHHADIVITSTASTLPILGKGAVEQALKRRRHRPMFLVDIAVPRDVEPEIGRLHDVFLYTVDDLRGVIDESLASRRAAAAEAEELIERRVGEFLAWQRALGATGTIKEFRTRADNVRARTLEQARTMVARGHSSEDALEFLAHTLTMRLLHDPTVALRQGAADERNDFLQHARELLGLEDPP
jgi:glutamyl-tRNA reductase